LAAIAFTVVLGRGAAAPQETVPAPSDRLAAIEAETGGRLGVAALDSESGRRIEYRASERFAMCSTFKLLLAAAVLARVDAGHESLERRLAYGPADLLDYAPVTKARVAEGGLPVGALCAAAAGVSDNTAANLLLATLGGPEGLTRYARELGDGVTRLDRTEPALNMNAPGDPRDTTTPAAMVANLQRLFLTLDGDHGRRRA
jgi:beta-lactamase class A